MYTNGYTAFVAHGNRKSPEIMTIFVAQNAPVIVPIHTNRGNLVQKVPEKGYFRHVFLHKSTNTYSFEVQTCVHQF